MINALETWNKSETIKDSLGNDDITDELDLWLGKLETLHEMIPSHITEVLLHHSTTMLLNTQTDENRQVTCQSDILPEVELKRIILLLVKQMQGFYPFHILLSSPY